MDTASDQTTALTQLAQEFILEKRRKRRWGLFFKTLITLLLILIAWKIFQSDSKKTAALTKPHAALVDVKGMIDDASKASADNITRGLRRAFKDKKTKGVILRLNSPGGSPVQASYVYNEIRRLRHKYPKIKTYAVCVDLCASAAYYIASAADEIYADPSSMVGSIGVVFNGFGFVDAMEKVGVSRRLVTAGKNKGFMDPFSPLNPDQEAHLKVMLAAVHDRFEKSVLSGRGGRLKQDDRIFSGLIWTGSEAKKLGLIDHFGSTGYVARDIIKTKQIVNYTVKPNVFERLTERFATSFSGALVAHLFGQPGLRASTTLQG